MQNQREKNTCLILGASSANSVDDSLNRVGPFSEVRNLMGLVHNAEDNAGLVLVVCRELAPDAGELGVGRPTLTDDSTVPACIVVKVDDDVGFGGGTEGGVHDGIVALEEASVETAAELRSSELPSEG